MNAKQFLNRLYYPTQGDNARRKTYPLYDTQPIATGTQDYYFFESALTNVFTRNKRFPLAGTEIFTITAISMFLQTEINTTAEIDNLNELLQQAYFEVWNQSRRVCKLPLLDILNYQFGTSLVATATATTNIHIGGNLNMDGFLGRKLSIPIIFNANSSFKFRLRITSQSATDFNGVNMRLYLHGVQTDKLTDFNWNDLQDNLFQTVPMTFYETRAISDGNQTTFELFQEGVADNLQSVYFPLSDIETFQVEAMEFFVNQPDTPISPETIYNSRITNQLRIRVDEVDYWESVMGTNMLSMLAGFDVALTTTPDVTVTELLHVRKQLVLPIPLGIPANGKVKVEIEQPGSSLGITGEITLALRGTATRRVA